MGELEAASWMWQILTAICVLHDQRICHRDVKPANFMFVTSRTRPEHELKLADFGVAVRCPAGTMLTEQIGTIAYMAPELYGLPQTDGYGLPVDVWATGIVMYNILLCGSHPFLQNGRLFGDRLEKGELDFRPGMWSFLGMGTHIISEEAQGLCTSMVAPDARSRLSAREAKSSSWFLNASMLWSESDGNVGASMPSRTPPTILSTEASTTPEYHSVKGSEETLASGVFKLFVPVCCSDETTAVDTLQYCDELPLSFNLNSIDEFDLNNIAIETPVEIFVGRNLRIPAGSLARARDVIA